MSARKYDPVVSTRLPRELREQVRKHAVAVREPKRRAKLSEGLRVVIEAGLRALAEREGAA